ncbi:MAG: putative membrane protein [Paraglaciecola sp.]
MSDNVRKNVGGSIERALKRELTLDLKALLKEGWQLTQTTKRPLLQGVFFIVSVGFLLIMLLQVLFNVSDLQQAPASMHITLNLLFTVITAPLMTAMMLMGMAHSTGQSIPFITLAKRLTGSALLVLAALMVAVLVDLGLKLLILPGIYLLMATAFTLPLLADKELRPGRAILLSIQVFNRYWRQLVPFYLLSFVLVLIGIFTFFIAYIWIVPFYFNSKGVLYRELFGIEVDSDPIDPDNTKDESVFHA